MSTHRNAPDFIGYSVRATKNGSYWTRIGAAWKHPNSGGFSIELIALPFDRKVVFLPPRTTPPGFSGTPAGE